MKTRLPVSLACIAFSACVSPDVTAGAEPISTDRPGLLFAPTVVPPGRAQIEAGLPSLSLADSAGDGSRIWSLPVAARLGVGKQLELRASLPTWTDARDEAGGTVARDEGFGDAEVGAKLELPLGASGPVAMLASLRLPTGEDPFTTDQVGASAFLLAGLDLGEGWWLQGLVGIMHAPIDDGEDPTTGALGVLLAHPLFERTSGYVELAVLPGLAHAAGQAYAGAGCTWTPLGNLQLDASFDLGLDDDSTDALLGLGASWFF